MSEPIFLVTGGGGFIGSNIVELLLKKGKRVRVLDNFSTGRRENLRGFKSDIELMEGDIRDPDAVKKAVMGVSFIMHQAALPSVVRSIEDPLTSHQVNITGALNMLLAARDAGVSRFVFASSSSVYGDGPELPKREDMTPRPLSPYAAGKLAGENYCRIFSRLYGLCCVSLRYFNVFGPRQDPASQYAAVIPKFFQAMFRGTAPVVHGDGNQSRDFTFVRNVAEANLLACEADIDAGETVNIACGEGTSINELFSIIRDIVGARVLPKHEDSRPGDVRHSRADVRRAREKIGYKPSIGLKEGLRLCAAHYGRHR